MEAWRWRYLRRPSVLILIATNLFPLVGVFYWGWNLFELMVVYWLETGIIGFWTAVHMILVGRWQAVFYVPFFIVHFGGFMAGHFFFLWMLFGGGLTAQISSFGDFVRVIFVETGLWLAALALFISHGISFVINVLAPYWKQWRGTARTKARVAGKSEPESIQDVMMAPYGRVVVMHFTIIFGAMLTMVLGMPVAAYMLLIALKIAVDVSAHVRQNFAPQAPPVPVLSTV